MDKNNKFDIRIMQYIDAEDIILINNIRWSK